MKILLIIYLLLNIIGLIMMKVDKSRAIHHEWRIPERRLWTIAVIGGALGLTLGMKMFRHKTKHQMFKWGLPFLTVINLVIISIICILMKQSS